MSGVWSVLDFVLKEGKIETQITIIALIFHPVDFLLVQPD